MPYNYKYIDHDYIYTDPKTGTMRNILNIVDKEELFNVELVMTAKRIDELAQNPIAIKNISSLFDIHKYIFQDVYEWAGHPRKVEISKGGRQFFPVSHFPNAMAFINGQLSEFQSIPASDINKLSFKLAGILDSVNFFHPFREGNGRSQREFLKSLSLSKGLNFTFDKYKNINIYKRYLEGTINGDINALQKLISENIIPIEYTDKSKKI
jgi:cell filamentation protein